MATDMNLAKVIEQLESIQEIRFEASKDIESMMDAGTKVPEDKRYADGGFALGTGVYEFQTKEVAEVMYAGNHYVDTMAFVSHPSRERWVLSRANHINVSEQMMYICEPGKEARPRNPEEIEFMNRVLEENERGELAYDSPEFLKMARLKAAAEYTALEQAFAKTKPEDVEKALGDLRDVYSRLRTEVQEL